MPNAHFYFAVLGAFVLTFAGSMGVALTQAQTMELPPLRTWLAAVMAGLVVAVERGAAVWPG